MKLSKKDKMQIMEWAVDLAKLEFKSQYNTLGSETVNAQRELEEMKRDDGNKRLPKPSMNAVIASTYKTLVQIIECESKDKSI